MCMKVSLLGAIWCEVRQKSCSWKLRDIESRACACRGIYRSPCAHMPRCNCIVTACQGINSCITTPPTYHSVHICKQSGCFLLTYLQMWWSSGACDWYGVVRQSWLILCIEVCVSVCWQAGIWFSFFTPDSFLLTKSENVRVDIDTHPSQPV